MYETIKVTLDEREYSALAVVSERELRSIAQQARAVIRDDLRRRGALREEVTTDVANAR